MSSFARTSFIIPARNAQATLAQTIDSVLAQSQADWEAVIVDDGSSDGTAQIASAYALRDPRIRVATGPGEGASAARNRGLALARGPRVVFLDSDDWLDASFLQRLQTALDTEPEAVAAYCDYRRVLPDGTMAPVHAEPLVAHDAAAAFARFCPVAIHAVLVDRDAVQRSGGFDANLRTCEDWDLWQRVAHGGGRWTHVAEPLAYYRFRADSLSNDTTAVLSDATTVIRRGHLRLGLDAQAADEAVAYCTLWCCAIDAGRDRMKHPLPLDALRRLPSGSDQKQALVATLIDGLMIGCQAAPSSLATRWGTFRTALDQLLRTIAEVWADPVAGRRTRYALERRLLELNDLGTPRALDLTLGIRVDLRAPAPLTPPPGIDRLLVALHDGARQIAHVDMGVLGTITPRQWLHAAAERLGWRATARSAGAWVVRTATPRRLGAAARALAGGMRLRALRNRSWRESAKVAARRSLIAASLDHVGDGDHLAVLDGLRLHAQAAAGPARNIVAPPSHSGETAALRNDSAAARRVFWDEFFRTRDPWHYDSAYEQEKYAIQLELLPPGRIEQALELACAEGHFTALLADRVDHLVATDISSRALQRAAERCSAHVNIEFRQLDFFADAPLAPMDLIVCSEVLYFLKDEAELRRVTERLAAALRPGGSLITAHALVLSDDKTRTGFDWGNPWGASTIARVLAETPTLVPVQSVLTELYRVDRFVRLPEGVSAHAPVVQVRAMRAELEPEVARWVVWGGAIARRAEVARSELHDCIPVLAYHRIAEDGPPTLARYRVDERTFGAQLSWLRRHGYHAIVSDELAWFLQEQHRFVGRPVVITFDDGYRDFAQTAWPLLRRHDFRAEVFIVTDLVGRSAEWDRMHGEPAPLMEPDTIHALAAQGVRFGSHLATHRGADGLSTLELAEELLRSRGALQAWTGQAPCAMAAPFGLTDERLQGLASECGYRIGFSTESGPATLRHRPMHLPRIEVRGGMTLDEFAGELEAAR